MIISTTSQEEREFIYYSAWAIIKEVYLKDVVSKEILHRLNKKNAEDMGCRELSLDM